MVGDGSCGDASGTEVGTEVVIVQQNRVLAVSLW